MSARSGETATRRVPPEIDQKMHAVLVETARRVAHDTGKPEIVPKRHVWYDANYVGMVDDRVVRWEGWSLNLRNIQHGNGTLYLDFVHNEVPLLERQKLWGASFTQAVVGLIDYVCLFTTGCHPTMRQRFEEHDLVCREYARTIHPSSLASAEGFLSSSIDWWVNRSLLLMQLRAEMHKAI